MKVLIRSLNILSFFICFTLSIADIHFDSTVFHHRKTRIGEGSRVLDYTQIERGCNIREHVFIGKRCEICKRANIGEKTVIYNNVLVPDNERISSEYFVIRGPKTKTILEMTSKSVPDDFSGDISDQAKKLYENHNENFMNFCRSIWSIDPTTSNNDDFTIFILQYLIKIYGKEKVEAMKQQPSNYYDHPELIQEHFVDGDNFSKKSGLDSDGIKAILKRFVLYFDYKRLTDDTYNSLYTDDTRCKNAERLKKNGNVRSLQSSPFEFRVDFTEPEDDPKIVFYAPFGERPESEKSKDNDDDPDVEEGDSDSNSDLNASTSDDSSADSSNSGSEDSSDASSDDSSDASSDASSNASSDASSDNDLSSGSESEESPPPTKKSESKSRRTSKKTSESSSKLPKSHKKKSQ